MVCVVERVLGGDVLEHMVVLTQKVICPGLHPLPLCIMFQVRPSLSHDLCRERKLALMYSSPVVVRSSTISLSCVLPSGSERSALKLPSTISNAPQGRWLETAMAHYLDEAYDRAI